MSGLPDQKNSRDQDLWLQKKGKTGPIIPSFRQLKTKPPFPISQLNVLIAPYIQGKLGSLSRPDKTNAFQVLLYKQF